MADLLAVRSRAQPLLRNQELKALILYARAWAPSCGCKSRRRETIPIEANRNCGRVTFRGKEAGSETAGHLEGKPPQMSRQLELPLWGRLVMKMSTSTRYIDSVTPYGDTPESSLEAAEIEFAHTASRADKTLGRFLATRIY